ncbi:MAG: methyltransferase [Chitinispirillaceae bacterium]|nr:methyltransferase [Chitinispirillaceae bacterium]
MRKLGEERPFARQLPSQSFLDRFAPLKPVDGCAGIVAHQAEDLFALWEAWELECCGECATPFWASVWPAAVVLARHIRSNRELVRDKAVLDLGCGGGVVAIAAALAGAGRVIANDIDPVALAIAQRNFTANDVCVEVCPQNLVDKPDLPPLDLILVADLFYHRNAANALVTFLRSARKNGIQVLIADGNRPFAPVTGINLISAETVPVSMELEGVPQREVKLMALMNE